MSDTSDKSTASNDGERNDFAAQAAQGDSESIAREFVDFLKENKKWWLAPIVISILALGALVLLGGSAAAPFIYTLF
jgi:hypothetical protein